MEELWISHLKGMMNTPWWELLKKEFEGRIQNIDDKLSSLLSTSSCILDEKSHKEIIMLNFEKGTLKMFLETPLEIIKRLNVQFTRIQ